jgi:1,4-dihydroxy-2-naphthoate octaprenyltransferase
MPHSADSPAPRQALDIGLCVNDAIKVYKQNWFILTLAAVVFDLLTVFSLLILWGPLSGGICVMLLRAYEREDKKVDFADMFRSLDKFAPLVGVFFLTLFPLLLASVFCVIPGLLLGTIWLYPYYLVVDEDKGVFESISNSKDIVMRKGFGPNLLLMVVLMALAFLPSAIPYAGIILAWFVTPIGWLVLTSAYIQLVQEDEGELDDLFDPPPVVL